MFKIKILGSLKIGKIVSTLNDKLNNVCKVTRKYKVRSIANNALRFCKTCFVCQKQNQMRLNVSCLNNMFINVKWLIMYPVI